MASYDTSDKQIVPSAPTLSEALTISEALTRCENNIRFVIEHPGMTPALKAFLKDGLERPAADVLNDLQILDFTLRRRCHLLVEREAVLGPSVDAPSYQSRAE